MGTTHNPVTLPFAPPPEFDDFIAGENHSALAAVAALINNESTTPTVYVWGHAGCGKTHLLRTAAADSRPQQPTFFVGGSHDLPPLMPGLLIADDIAHAVADKRLLLFDWLNKTAPDQKYRILAAANAPPAAAGLGEEIAARFTAGLVFRLREISPPEKKQVLVRYARRRGFSLPEPVMDLFLTRLPRDMTSLTAALRDLDKFLLVQQKPLTTPMARQWLREHTDTLRERMDKLF